MVIKIPMVMRTIRMRMPVRSLPDELPAALNGVVSYINAADKSEVHSRGSETLGSIDSLILGGLDPYTVAELNDAD